MSIDAFKDVEHKETIDKYMAGVIEDFLPALKEIAQLQSSCNKPYGKYERGSWITCPPVVYKDAFWRHVLEGFDTIDEETGKPHDVAIAWNALVRVSLRLIKEKASPTGSCQGQCKHGRMRDQRKTKELKCHSCGQSIGTVVSD